MERVKFLVHDKNPQNDSSECYRAAGPPPCQEHVGLAEPRPEKSSEKEGDPLTP